MGAPAKLFCGFKNRPAWLIALAVALLLLLYLLREWLWGLFLLYLGALVLLGLLGGMRLAQAILRKLCWKVSATQRDRGPRDILRPAASTCRRTPTSGPTR